MTRMDPGAAEDRLLADRDLGGPDFIGLGAQRSGTSWIYACLYEHPGIHIPVKEIHFFSRERHWSRGYGWYEEHFARRPQGACAGEFSTTYLADPGVADRIHRRYADARLIVSLRNPIDRAYSNFRNDVMAGAVEPGTSFECALATHPEYLEQGRYFAQISRYLRHFPREQLLLLVYEDSLTRPLAFIQSIYRFIGVDERFVPTMLAARVNEGRIPRFPIVDRGLNKASAAAVRAGLGRVWWLLKKAEVGRRIRHVNTRARNGKTMNDDRELRQVIFRPLQDDIRALADLLGRDLGEWRP